MAVAPVDNPIDRRVVREVMRAVPTGFVGQILVLAFTDLLFAPYLPPWLLGTWTLLHLLNLWLRERFVRAYLRLTATENRDHDKEADRIFWRYMASLLVSALLWCGMVAAMDQLPAAYHFLVYALVIVLTFGATISIGPITPLYLMFVLPMNAAMMLRLWPHPDPVYKMAALFLLVTLSFSVKAARKHLQSHKALIIRESNARAMKEFFRDRATHDPLTGLLNRASFFDLFRQALSRARQEREGLALFFIDVDRFKAINDTYGHAIGDRVIETVAKRLVGSVRSNDTVARLSGDEFVVVARGVRHPGDAERIARHLTEAFAAPIRHDKVVLRVKVSVGIALYPLHGSGVEALMKRADEAMYRAKKERVAYRFGEEPPKEAEGITTRPDPA